MRNLVNYVATLKAARIVPQSVIAVARIRLATLLTRQVLSSTVTIRLGGSRAALRRQIKLKLTAVFESPIPPSINEGGGDSGARWHL
jgi:hypothetical protein